MKERGIVSGNVKSNADLSFICFPYAGGSPSAYSSWMDWLPDELEVLFINPPGRGTRFSDTPHKKMVTLVDEIEEGLTPLINKPFIFFGHSLGSRVAFEVAIRLLEKYNLKPTHFIASGSNAPQYIKDSEKISQLPKLEFINKLKKYGGTPKEILENEELLDVFMPLLRADFKLFEDYLFEKNQVLDCPFSLFSGVYDDCVTLKGLKSWSEVFTVEHEIEYFSGGHFFIDECKGQFSNRVISILNNYL